MSELTAIILVGILLLVVGVGLTTTSYFESQVKIACIEAGNLYVDRDCVGAPA